MRQFAAAALLAVTTLGGCAVREARVALSPELEMRAERLELVGMGAGTRGDFRLGEASGTFSRSAERLGIFDPLVVKHRGGGSFRLAGSATAPDLAGRCSYREGEVNVGPISVTPDRLVFHCEFARAGRQIEAGLVIHDPKGALGTLHGRDERTGTLFYEGRQIDIRSVHRDRGGGLPAPTPLGYSFSTDGREIGAVDLNGLTKTLFVPRSGHEREAIIAAGLALSTFWDPAELQ